MITRRLTIGALAALGLTSRAMAVPGLVTFQLRIAIPSPGVKYLGDVFAGGDKAIIEGAFDMSKSGASALSVTKRFIGATKKYASSAASAVAGKPEWYVNIASGAAPTESGQSPVTSQSVLAEWATPDGASHGAHLVVNAPNPLVTGAPAIDADLTLGLRVNGGRVECRVTGSHDGFPDYRLRVGTREVYGYDCVAAGDTPLALFPPMERTAAVAWTPI